LEKPSKLSAKINFQKIVDAVGTLQTQLTIAQNQLHQLKGKVYGKKNSGMDKEW
jgi:hypothetical protein